MKIVKPVVCFFLIIVLVLILIPFSITKIVTPQTEKKTDKLQSEEFLSSSIEQEKIPSKIKVFRTDTGRTESIRFEKYVKGVVSSEMPSEFDAEALKAQSVAARTYSLSRLLRAEDDGNPTSHPDAPVCDSVHCQVYQSELQLTKNKGSDWMNSGWKKICDAVDDTKGELLYYDGKLVEQALFHSSSGGKTENCEDVFASAVPYLVSVDSPYEEDATHKNEKATFTVSEFSSKIKAAYPNVQFGTISAQNIKILSHSSGGRVERIKIGSGTLEGREVREALGLYSANFTVSTTGDSITFTSVGSGHGVGMSQYGANGMAKKGYSYKEILSHYYSGTVVY